MKLIADRALVCSHFVQQEKQPIGESCKARLEDLERLVKKKKKQSPFIACACYRYGSLGVVALFAALWLPRDPCCFGDLGKDPGTSRSRRRKVDSISMLNGHTAFVCRIMIMILMLICTRYANSFTIQTIQLRPSRLPISPRHPSFS